MATPDDVRRLAALARIEVPEADLEGFASEFDAILAYVGKLDTLTIPEGTTELPARRTVLRADDGPTPSGTWTEALTAQFPERSGDSLSVKKIISHD